MQLIRFGDRGMNMDLLLAWELVTDAPGASSDTSASASVSERTSSATSAPASTITPESTTTPAWAITPASSADESPTSDVPVMTTTSVVAPAQDLILSAGDAPASVPEDNITLTLYFALADTSGPYTIALTGAQARTMQRWLAARSGALLR